DSRKNSCGHFVPVNTRTDSSTGGSVVNFAGKTVGFGLTGSHCTHDQVLPQMQRLVDLGAEVIPVVSYTVANVDSKFGEAKMWLQKIRDITGQDIISTIPEAEPLGPSKRLDVMLVAP